MSAQVEILEEDVERFWLAARAYSDRPGARDTKTRAGLQAAVPVILARAGVPTPADRIEYDEVDSLDAVQDLAATGWRVHTASHVEDSEGFRGWVYLLQREIRTPQGASDARP